MEISKNVKVIALGILVVIITGFFLSMSPVEIGTSPVLAKATQKSCDFMSVEGTTYAFCADGSEYRIADSVTPDSSK